MPELIVFKSLIQEQGIPFIVHRKDNGSHVNGKWTQSTAATVELTGIILPLSVDDLKYDESGTYSTKERKLFVTEPLAIETIVIYKGNRYIIQNFKDLTDYTDVHIYLMRWHGVDNREVSAIDPIR